MVERAIGDSARLRTNLRRFEIVGDDADVANQIRGMEARCIKIRVNYQQLVKANRGGL